MHRWRWLLFLMATWTFGQNWEGKVYRLYEQGQARTFLSIYNPYVNGALPFDIYTLDSDGLVLASVTTTLDAGEHYQPHLTDVFSPSEIQQASGLKVTATKHFNLHVYYQSDQGVEGLRIPVTQENLSSAENRMLTFAIPPDLWLRTDYQSEDILASLVPDGGTASWPKLGALTKQRSPAPVLSVLEMSQIITQKTFAQGSRLNRALYDSVAYLPLRAGDEKQVVLIDNPDSDAQNVLLRFSDGTPLTPSLVTVPGASHLSVDLSGQVSTDGLLTLEAENGISEFGVAGLNWSVRNDLTTRVDSIIGQGKQSVGKRVGVVGGSVSGQTFIIENVGDVETDVTAYFINNTTISANGTIHDLAIGEMRVIDGFDLYGGTFAFGYHQFDGISALRVFKMSSDGEVSDMIGASPMNRTSVTVNSATFGGNSTLVPLNTSVNLFVDPIFSGPDWMRNYLVEVSDGQFFDVSTTGQLIQPITITQSGLVTFGVKGNLNDGNEFIDLETAVQQYASAKEAYHHSVRMLDAGMNPISVANINEPIFLELGWVSAGNTDEIIYNFGASGTRYALTTPAHSATTLIPVTAGVPVGVSDPAGQSVVNAYLTLYNHLSPGGDQEAEIEGNLDEILVNPEGFYESDATGQAFRDLIAANIIGPDDSSSDVGLWGLAKCLSVRTGVPYETMQTVLTSIATDPTIDHGINNHSQNRFYFVRTDLSQFTYDPGDQNYLNEQIETRFDELIPSHSILKK